MCLGYDEMAAAHSATALGPRTAPSPAYLQTVASANDWTLPPIKSQDIGFLTFIQWVFYQGDELLAQRALSPAAAATPSH